MMNSVNYCISECIEFGYHWMSAPTQTITIRSTTADSPKRCQQKCQKDSECNWFAYGNNDKPTGCWLQSTRGLTRSNENGRASGATGPKTCSSNLIINGLNNNNNISNINIKNNNINRFPVINNISEHSTSITLKTAFRYPQPNSEASGHSGLYQWR